VQDFIDFARHAGGFTIDADWDEENEALQIGAFGLWRDQNGNLYS
jgi:hypothetical protein